MAFNSNGVQFLALAGVALSGAALAVTVRSSVRVGRMRRVVSIGQIGTGDGKKADLDLAADVVRQVARLDRENGELFDGVRRSLQRVGLVRFDAFEDMGGHLSFCAALLDIDGSGIVLTSINGRTETRMYAKPVDKGSSKYHLSEEEQSAIKQAMAVEAT